LFRLHVVWRAVRSVARVSGDFVEFGSSGARSSRCCYGTVSRSSRFRRVKSWL
jgi:hypothetical protein